MRPTIILLIALCVSFCSAQGPMMQPKLLSQRAPDYPEAAKKLRMEGKVLLNAHIGIDGKVKGTEFAQGVFTFAGKTREISSSVELELIDPAYKETARSLVTSARTSALAWKFSPATLGGSPIEATIVIPFTYKLTVQPQKPSPSRQKQKQKQ